MQSGFGYQVATGQVIKDNEFMLLYFGQFFKSDRLQFREKICGVQVQSPVTFNAGLVAKWYSNVAFTGISTSGNQYVLAAIDKPALRQPKELCLVYVTGGFVDDVFILNKNIDQNLQRNIISEATVNIGIKTFILIKERCGILTGN